MRSCPVCEESVPADTKICPSCSTDLSLFPVDESQSADALLADNDSYVADILKQAEAAPSGPAAPPPVDLVYDESVECPACGKQIPADAAKCPHCGAEFEVQEVFECPLCKALVDVSVNKCPSCGAMFEDEPAPAAQPEPQPAPAAQAAPPPRQEEAPAKPASFVDRLKQIKDEPVSEKPQPAPAQKRDMSFAERMKAMKNGTLADAAAPQQPETRPTAQPQPVPAPAQEPKAQPQPATQAEAQPAVQATQQAPQPAKAQSITDRVQSLKQSTQQQPAQQPAPQPAVQATQPTPQPAAHIPTQQPAAPESAKDGYKELPHHIAEVKKLLLLANELKLDVSTSKALINKAVTAGKNRDLDNAIKLVKEGKAGLERDIRASVAAKLRTLETAIGLEKKAGKDVTGLEASAETIRGAMEVGDLQQAWEMAKSLEDSVAKSASGKLSEVEFETISRAIADAEFLHLNVYEAKTHYEGARKASAAGNAAGSSQSLKQAMESLNKALPAFIAGEMRKAKVTLREVKMMNVDITAPVAMLKEANDNSLRGDYCAALADVRRFKEFIDRANPA